MLMSRQDGEPLNKDILVKIAATHAMLLVAACTTSPQPEPGADAKTRKLWQCVGCCAKGFFATTTKKNLVVLGWKCLIKSASHFWYGRNET